MSGTAPGPTGAQFSLDGSALAVIRDVWSDRGLLWVLTSRLLRVRYAHHLLGVVWALVTVIIPLVVLLVLRRHIGRVPHGVSGLGFIASGLVCWQFFAAAVSGAATSLVGDSGILKRIAAAREVIPLSRIALAMVTSGITTVVFLAVGLLRGDFVANPAALLAVPLSAVGLVVLATGVALALSVAIVTSRDLGQLVGVVLQFGIFYSPILFPLTDLPRSVRPFYVMANPVGGYIHAVRTTLVLGDPVPWAVLGLALAVSCLVLLVGSRLFRFGVPRVIDLA